MQKTILTILLSAAAALGGFGQSYRVLVNRPGEIPVIDFSLDSANVFDIDRSETAYLNFPSAVQVSGRRDILLSYLKTDTGRVREIILKRSGDAGKTWSSVAVNHEWKNVPYGSLSMFNMGKTVLKGSNDRNVTMNNSLVLFNGGNPLMISASYTNGSNWSAFYPANYFGAFRVSGLIQLYDGRIMAVFHDDGRFLYHENDTVALRKSVLYKIYSSDGGLTWSRPEVMLKHNLYGLYDGIVFRAPGKKSKELIAIASERTTQEAYIAFSSDEGNSWTYPEKLPPFIQGDRFGSVVYNKDIYLVFRDMCKELNDGSPNPSFGDLVMWTGDLKELVRGNRNGVKIRLADNYPVEHPDFDDRKTFDCGYPTVLKTGKTELSVIAYGRWDAESPTFIRNFVFDPKSIRKILRQIQ